MILRCGIFFLVICSISAQTNYDFKTVITNAKQRVFPALVFVKPIVEVFYSGKAQRQQVFGSGVIISADGYVVTNNHVAENAKSIKCVLSDKRQVPAKIIGLDKETDLALLKLDLPENTTLPFAKFGNSNLIEEGQFVMAMGSPFGFSRSISFGIISYTRRYLREGPYNLWIQTDAAINPGNSGGPLVDDTGNIIGINTLGARANNIAFSIPANTVKEVIAILKEKGQVTRTWTGITFQALRDYSKEVIINADAGVLVASVDQNSPAKDAGIQTGDIILECNNQKIMGIYMEDLPATRAFFAKLPNKSIADIKIRRGDKTMHIKMHLRPKGKIKGDNFECDRWDMTVKGINKFSSPNMAFFREKGVYIQGVQYVGNAQSSHFLMGDIILQIDGENIDSLEKIKTIYEKSLNRPDSEKKLLFKLFRQGLPYYLVLDYRRDFKEIEGQ
ncbi:trypsin-like peptidase domain-containing protein [Candidatus Uabimicrobium amorphum]|uniref:Peptidase n=1 Tax=Uabimicrobium amorphum TaxID=2596890 RepID=A0A5S9INT3_UABAM|nr:trypsin-like peptidase domain-containing protein [Candidatus Uabimicrobium amorphum]BBM84731.1 peptidase [Candidatus Uabimicrobium amorphum]